MLPQRRSSVRLVSGICRAESNQDANCCISRSGFPTRTRYPKQRSWRPRTRSRRQPGDVALRYGFGQGPTGLRDWLAVRRTETESFEVTGDWFQMTNGSSRAIDLFVRSLVNPRNVIIAESPTYMGTLHNFRGVTGGRPFRADGPRGARYECARAFAERSRTGGKAGPADLHDLSVPQSNGTHAVRCPEGSLAGAGVRTRCDRAG